MLKVKVFDGQITKNFNITEFACHANNEVLINARVIDHIQRLQKLRDWYLRPMIINSGYRTKEYNKKVGGATNSKHIEGIASDIALPEEFYSYTKERQNEFLNNVKNKWIELCSEDGLGGGIGFYDAFFHLDSRESGRYAFWDEREQVLLCKN